MYYKQRELRRMWEVELYDGDKDDPNVTTHKETVVAWNQVEAIRRGGGNVASPPVALYYVTWPDVKDGPIFRIDDPKVGPIVVAEIAPSVAIPDEATI